MKLGIRVPSLKKRLAARLSVKRVIRHRLGLKGPRGFGWFTNPQKTLYNRVYSRTTFDLFGALGSVFRTTTKAKVKKRPKTQMSSISIKQTTGTNQHPVPRLGRATRLLFAIWTPFVGIAALGVGITAFVLYSNGYFGWAISLGVLCVWLSNRLMQSASRAIS